jgi:hypothetical protein
MSDLQDKITRYWNLTEVSKTSRAKADELKFEIAQEMKRDGATAVPHPDLEVQLKQGSPKALDDVLRPLLETDYADELIDSGAYTPPEPTMTKPKWNFVKLNLFKKYGDAIAEIIDRGTLRESETLQIKEKNNG